MEGICSISPWRITVKSHYTSCTSWGKILSFLNAFLSPRLISASQSLLLLLLWRDTLLLTFYSISILSGLQFEQCHGNDLMQHKHLSSNDGSQGRHLLSAKKSPESSKRRENPTLLSDLKLSLHKCNFNGQYLSLSCLTTTGFMLANATNPIIAQGRVDWLSPLLTS